MGEEEEYHIEKHKQFIREIKAFKKKGITQRRIANEMLNSQGNIYGEPNLSARIHQLTKITPAFWILWETYKQQVIANAVAPVGTPPVQPSETFPAETDPARKADDSLIPVVNAVDLQLTVLRQELQEELKTIRKEIADSRQELKEIKEELLKTMHIYQQILDLLKGRS